MMKLPLFPPPPPRVRKAAVAKKGTKAQALLKALDKQQETADKRFKRQRAMEDFREQQRVAHERKELKDEHGNVIGYEPSQKYRERIFLRDQLATTIRRA